MLKLKKALLIIIDLVKKTLNLEKLNHKELKGFNTSLTKLRLLSNTKVLVPFSLGRTVRGVSFDKNVMLDPAGRLCSEISKGLNNELLCANLAKTFDKEKCYSASDIVHLTNNNILKGYPAWSIVMPWENLNIKDMFENYPDIFFKNRRSRGLVFENNDRLSIIKVMYSSKFVENRVSQMKELFDSINSKGLIKDSNLPKINILKKQNEWRWFMGDGGNHRSYILSCLGHEFFSARVSNIIDKDNIKNWHNVKNGTYSKNEAEFIFDSYFEGSKVFRGMV